jgi:hypothetical protein
LCNSASFLNSRMDFITSSICMIYLLFTPPPLLPVTGCLPCSQLEKIQSDSFLMTVDLARQPTPSLPWKAGSVLQVSTMLWNITMDSSHVKMAFPLDWMANMMSKQLDS